MHRIFFIVWLLLVLSNFALANPSHKQFDAAMAVHGPKQIKTLQEDTYKLYESINVTLLKIKTSASQNKLGKVPEKAWGETNVALHRMSRYSRQLISAGETAGIDFQYRHAKLQSDFAPSQNAYRGTPEGQRARQIAVDRLNKLLPALQKKSAELQRLGQQKNWEQAEKELYIALEQLDYWATFVDSGLEPYYKPLEPFRAPIDAAMDQVRYQTMLQVWNKQLESADFNKLIDEVTAAAKTLSSRDKVAVADQQLSGPELWAHFARRWIDAQVTAQHLQAYAWAVAGAKSSTMMLGGGTNDFAKPFEQRAQEYQAFCPRMVAALCGLIEADAARAGEAEVEALYVQYLPVVARYVARSHEPLQFQLAAAQSLGKLADKSPTFAELAGNYQAATGELVRWRQRVAAVTAQARLNAFAPLEQRFAATAKSQNPTMLLFPDNFEDPASPKLFSAAPECLPTIWERLNGQAVFAPKSIGVANGSRTISQYRGGSYANTPLPLQWSGLIEEMKRELQVADDKPPLALPSALALETAAQGDLQGLGGRIVGAHLEGLVPRFANVKPATWVITPLGMMPPSPPNANFLPSVVMRFEIDPVWVWHSYFFLDIPQVPVTASR